MRIRPGSLVPACAALALSARPAAAHVKWFSRFSFADAPRPLASIASPTFVALLVLSMVTVGALVVIDRRIESAALYRRVNGWLDARRASAPVVMRVGIGAAMLLAWQADALLAPEMAAPPLLGWLQFGVALLLLLEATVPIGGALLLALYAVVVVRAGVFHALDYLFFAGAGYYLAVSRARDERLRGSGLPALYLTVGFSLCWVALEKMVYPQWATYLLEQHPTLSLGLDARFFLLAAAFVEFSLGYLLIINLLQRPLALLITLVFFTTTLVFGKVEVIGHTPLHAALVVFLLEGQGTTFVPPIALHRRLGLRTTFAAVNLALLLGLLLVPYTAGAERLHRLGAAAER